MRITFVTNVTRHRLDSVLDSVLDSNSPQPIGDLLARRVTIQHLSLDRPFET